jgi:hypothetical protein
VRFRVFHSEEGDCLLVFTDDAAHHVLIDGGKERSYTAHVRDVLADLRGEGKRLDVVYLSHIDEDHIQGINTLVGDEVAWRIHEFQVTGDPNLPEPEQRRPPEIGEVWHNSLFELLGADLAPSATHALEMSASILAGSPDPDIIDLAARADNLATGERSSFEFSRRISAEQLDIPLNPRADGELMLRGETGETFSIGNLDFFLLGPSADDLPALRDRWQKYIDRNADAIAKLQATLIADEERLHTLSADLVANPMIATGLGDGLAKVTAPNLASLMFLVEDGGQSILLTGDGVSEEILDGLAHHGKLDRDGRIHVSVLKVQHHGAEANVTADFVNRVTADHYVFCGNGAHHNPELVVVESFAKARTEGLGGADPVGPDTDFKFWFTSSSASPNLTAKRKAHMKELEDLVRGTDTTKGLIEKSGDRLSVEFLDEGHLDIL